MAVTCKWSEQFILETFTAEHDVTSDSLKAILLDVSFPGYDAATMADYGDISTYEIATGYGYTQKTLELTTVATSIVSNKPTITADDIEWTASGGAIEASIACAIINDTHASDTIVCCIEFGATYTPATGTKLKIGLTNGLARATVNP